MNKLIPFLICVFLFIGFFEGLIDFSGTVQLVTIFSLLGLGVLHLNFNRSKDIISIGFYILFFYGVSRFYALSQGDYPEYFTAKADKLFLFFSLAIILGYSFRKQLDLKLEILISILKYFLIVILIFALFELPSFSLAERLRINDGNPIWLGRAISLFVLLVFFSKIKKFYKVFLIILGLVLIFLTKSSGPLFAIIIMFGTILYFNIAPKINEFQRFVLIALIIVVALFQQSYFLGALRDNDRTDLYILAYEIFLENPLGNGIGAFSNVHYLLYPHNIFIELLAELGIVFFLLFLILNIKILKFYLTNYNLLTVHHKIFFFWYLLELINAQFSGDMTSPKALYIIIFISLINRKQILQNRIELV